MTSRAPRYRAYLLRLWDANSHGPPTWHASLEDTHTGERWGFADLERLVAFLAAEIGDGRPEEDGARAAADD
jgi:hypothetical protein